MALDLMDRLIDFCQDAVDANEVTGFSKSTIVSEDVLNVDNLGISFQSAPSSPPVRYFDRSRQQDLNVMVKVKHDEQKKAIDAINELFEMYEKLDALDSGNGSFEFISSGIYTLPALVDKTPKENYIYAGLLRVSFYVL